MYVVRIHGPLPIQRLDDKLIWKLYAMQIAGGERQEVKKNESQTICL